MRAFFFAPPHITSSRSIDYRVKLNYSEYCEPRFQTLENRKVDSRKEPVEFSFLFKFAYDRPYFSRVCSISHGHPFIQFSNFQLLVKFRCDVTRSTAVSWPLRSAIQFVAYAANVLYSLAYNLKNQTFQVRQGKAKLKARFVRNANRRKYQRR